MNTGEIDRRDFLERTAGTSAALTLAGISKSAPAVTLAELNSSFPWPVVT